MPKVKFTTKWRGHSMSIYKARKILTISAVLIILTIPMTNASANMNTADAAKLESLIAGEQRKETNSVRDQYRHPSEVLKFFGLKDEMAVMEIWPAGGWWTEILAPFLSENGRYVAAHFPAEGGPAYWQRSLNSFKDMLAKDPQNYGKVEIVSLSPNAELSGSTKPGSMDLVLTFRNLHNWMSQGSQQAVFVTMFDTLKPGGYLGVVEHRESAEKTQDPKAKSGYVREDYAISLAEGAGFKLIAKSEINANLNDTKDYPGGVWTLPPSLREGDREREKYSAIGESDRFTLLFQKPEN